MIVTTMKDFLDPKNDKWVVWDNARKGAVCDSCFIVKAYAIPHNGSGTPFYRRKKYERGKMNKFCYCCYQEKVVKEEWL